MQTSKLSVGTQRFCESHRPVGVVRVGPCCPNSVIRAPVRPLAVLISGISSTPAGEKATTHQAPANPVKETWAKVQGLVKNTAKAAAILGVALALVLGTPDAAHAARSAGRAGGFHSAAPSRSYGGGGMGMGSRGGYSGGYSRGYSGGFNTYTAPRIYSAPIIVPGPPVYSPGMMVAPGTAAVVTTGPGIIDIAIVSMFLVMAASAATGVFKGSSDDWEMAGGGKPTLTRVQVGLMSLARELKHDLDRMAARADTSSSRGLHTLLQEVVLALLRNPSYCIYGAASQRTCDSTSSLETAFNKASMKERTKFEQETLVNVAGASPSRSSYRRANSSSSDKPDELVVVTLLVATDGSVDMPAKIDSVASLQRALQALGSLQQEQVLGVELMWTPQAEGDYYTRDEIISDYPSLRQL